MAQIFVVIDREDEESGYSSVQLRATSSDALCLHQMNGRPESEGIYLSKGMLRGLRDQLNKMEI